MTAIFYGDLVEMVRKDVALQKGCGWDYFGGPQKHGGSWSDFMINLDLRDGNPRYADVSDDDLEAAIAVVRNEAAALAARPSPVERDNGGEA